MQAILGSIVIGVGATVLFDLWRWGLARAAGEAAPDWGLPGRWFAHLARGTFRHDGIAQAAPVTGEVAIGWVAHYATGIAWGGLTLLVAGVEWLGAPTLLPAMAVGLGTIAAGWFVMSPGMGNGLANSRSANPGRARAQGLAAHAVFGLGLWLSALALAALRG